MAGRVVNPTSRKRKPAAVKAEATRLHSQLVRALGYCQHCGDAWRSNGSKLECAHIISRRFSRTRTDLTNAFCLCSRCHMRFTEWPLEFAAFVQTTVGDDAYQALRDLRDEVTLARVRLYACEARCRRIQRQLDTALRDCDLVALMAKDRDTALAFLRDQHGIDALGESA